MSRRRRAGPHESVNKTVLRCLQKVSIVRSVLRRVTGRSFHARGPATANDLSPKVLSQRCMTQTDRLYVCVMYKDCLCT